MRKRWISGGQDFSGVRACFVVVAFVCALSHAQDVVVVENRRAISAPIASPATAILPQKARPQIEEAKNHRRLSRFPAYSPPQRNGLAHVTKAEKKAVRGFDERPTKSKEQVLARDEMKKSADDVKQEARLIALNGQGITFEQRRIMKDAAAEWRRQLRLQLIGNVTREAQTDDGLEEAKRVAREQARKVAEEAKSQTRRE